MGSAADWAMVIITFIYVIATIVICIFNYKSLKATQLQIEQLKVQNRTEMMPILSIKRCADNRERNGIDIIYLYTTNAMNDGELFSTDITFCAKNVGHGIAKDISYNWKTKPKGANPYIVSLPENDERVMLITFVANNKMENCRTSSMEIQFSDYFGNHYHQAVAFSLLIDCDIRTIALLNVSITVPVLSNTNIFSRLRPK